MPPKPWETASSNKTTIDSGEIASGTKFTSPSNPGDPFQEDGSNSRNDGFGSNEFGNNNNGYNSYSSNYGSGFGSGSGYGSYGGYGGYGSRFGSYGGSYGGYGGFGSYGGYGNRMGGPGQQGGFMDFALRYLDSFSYGVSSLCEMTRNIEMNAEGLSKFWGSMRNILVRLFGWFARSFKGGKEMLFKAIHMVREKLFSKPFLAGLIFSGEGTKMKVYNILLRFCIMTLAFTLIAPVIKGKN